MTGWSHLCLHPAVPHTLSSCALHCVWLMYGENSLSLASLILDAHGTLCAAAAPMRHALTLP